jgi:AraC-like DNA-binding protein
MTILEQSLLSQSITPPGPLAPAKATVIDTIGGQVRPELTVVVADGRIATVAARVGYSRYHFVRRFREAYGETPGQYLSRRRVERAKDLLRSANLTVTEICMLVGFSSLGTFCTRFKQQVGMTPGEFRRKARHDGDVPIPGCFLLFWAGGFREN